MEKEIIVWNKVLTAVMKMPGVRVDRISFLRKELRPYCNQSRLQMIGSVRPYTVVSEAVIDRLARQCVRSHTALATATSTVVGLPGGLAMAATLPADLTQYFYHVFVLAQKLAYLYGYPDLFEMDEAEGSNGANGANGADEANGTNGTNGTNGNEGGNGASPLPSTTFLTIFMGVMMGAPVAENGLGELSKAVAGNAVTRLPRMALTRGAVVPIATQVAKLISSRYSKAGVAKSVGRLIPLAGGLFTGGLTLFTFRRGANRLRRLLSAQRHLFGDETISDFRQADLKQAFIKGQQAERDPQKVERAAIEAMINLAKINDQVSPEKYQAVEQRIARSHLAPADKLDLLGNIDSDRSYDVDFDLLATDRAAAKDCYEALCALTPQPESQTMAEKIYLSMVAQKLRLTS